MGGFSIISIWGIIVGAQRLVAARKRQEYGYGPGDGVGDYFFYGYRYYRRMVESARQNQARRFHAEYLKQLSLQIAALRSVTPARKLGIAKQVLRSISAIISSYHNIYEQENTRGIRSNLMLVKGYDGESRALFVSPGQKVSRCLELVTYDDDETQPGIILPVHDVLAQALPGAPRAFIHPDGVDNR